MQTKNEPRVWWEPSASAEGSNASALRKKSWTLIMRFSAGLGTSGAKAHPCEMSRFSAGLKSSYPLLKQGAPTRFGVDDIGGLFSSSHADTEALTFCRVPAAVCSIK